MCEWMFNGIGTAVFSLASGAVIGGFTGCIICCRKYGIQIQRQAMSRNSISVCILAQKSLMEQAEQTVRQFFSRRNQGQILLRYRLEESEMKGIKQTQRGSRNARQFQAETIIINFGVDESRTREIFEEMFELAVNRLSKSYGCSDEDMKTVVAFLLRSGIIGTDSIVSEAFGMSCGEELPDCEDFIERCGSAPQE